MLRKVCFVAVFAVSALPQVCFAVSSSAAASSLSQVCFVAVFAVSSLSKVCFVAVSAVPLSAAASSSSTAFAASLAFGKNRATTLAGWRTISLSKSTSFSCKTMLFFCIYCLIRCTFDNRKVCSLQKKQIHADPRPCTFCNQKMCPSPKMVVEKLVDEKKCALL